MKIHVVSRSQIKRLHKKDENFSKSNWIISIYSSELDASISYETGGGRIQSYSPLPSYNNILKLKFDDVTEKDSSEYIHFSEVLAKKIKDFIAIIEDNGSKDFYVHCDAGVSRSGAVGYLLNEYFNKYLTRNEEDNQYFERVNSHIMPNPEVVRILKRELFGMEFSGITVNDYSYDEDGNRIDNVTKI